ncbi:MAG: hypothetical protein PHT76_11525 [Anaerostipes sp.]|nr:hypothetical protein [Anaerostipes sp.]
MKYQNTVTGAVIDIVSEIKGENWKAAEPSKASSTKKATKAQGKAVKK